MFDGARTPQWKGQRVGGRGLEFLGMPTVWDYKWWSKDEYLYSAMWTYQGRDSKDRRTYAALYAELWVLQAMGLIEIVCIEPPDYGEFALWVDFKYTDEGALLAWEGLKSDA